MASEEVVVQPKALEESSDAAPASASLTAQEEADREFALKLSQRLNDSPSIPAATAATADPVASPPQPVATEVSVDEDYQLALRLSQELNEGSPAVIAAEQRPPQTFAPVHPVSASAPVQITAPAPAPALTQEEIDRRLALELEQALNVDETTDREVALRISQQLNEPTPPPPGRAVYHTLTPGGPKVVPAVPYVQQRSAEDIRIEAEIARVTRSLSNPENDADTKVALELQLQELVAYQRQLQRRRIRTEDEEHSGPEDDFVEDGLEMLNEGYEKFKESSKDLVKKIDVYGGKVEQTLRSWFSKLIPSTKPEEPPASPVSREPHLVPSSSAGGDETLEGDDEDQPLSRGNLRRRAPRPPSVEGAAFTPTTTPIGERHSNVEKGFSLRLVEKLDQVTDELGSTVVDLIWGDKSTSPAQPVVASSASPTSPASSEPTTTSTTTTSSSTTTTGATARVDLPDFKGGNVKDGDDGMFPL